MGRRALQRSPKPSSNPCTPPPLPDSGVAVQTDLPSDELSARLQIPQSPGGRGLDRVLLERNLERLLTDRSVQGHSPDLEKLLLARDRSREPLHLADLSLDDWHPKMMNDGKKETKQQEEEEDGKEEEEAVEVEENPVHASSMPELAVPGSSDTTPGGDSTTPCSPGKRERGLLSVRFRTTEKNCYGKHKKQTNVGIHVLLKKPFCL